MRGVGWQGSHDPQHVVELSFPHGEGFVQRHRSRFGGHPSERVATAMAPSLPGAFLGARFVPAAWSAGAWGLGKGLVFLNFQNISKKPKNQW